MIFCDEELPEYITRECGVDFAGVVGIGLIHIDEDPEVSDLSDPDFWNGVTSEDKPKYFVIRNTRGEYSPPEETTEEDLVGYLVTGASHSAVIEVPDIQGNRDFWDYVSLRNWRLCIVTGGGLLYYIRIPVSFYAKIVNKRSVKSEVFFNVQMKWQDLSIPLIVDAPEGIFSGDEMESSEGIFDYTFDDTFE